MMKWFESISKILIRYWLMRHLWFWLAVCISLSIVHSSILPEPALLAQTTLIFLPYNLTLVYVAMYWVLPPIFENQHRPFAYRLLIYLGSGWVFTYLYRGYVVVPFRTGQVAAFNPSFHLTFILGAWITGLVIVGVAVGIKLFRFWYRRNQTNQQLIRQTLSVELQILRAQIHPHFLFNTLNNLYSLTLKQSPQAPDMILKLEKLLHYMIHECNVPVVTLEKEIEFIRNYIQLEKLRYGSRLTVSVNIRGENGTTFIAPLLLIPFVENAFKHGSAKQIGSVYINLALTITDNRLRLRLENSCNEQPFPTANENKGLGLVNVRQRLALAYPNAHELTMMHETDRFIVEFSLDLGGQRDLTQGLSSVLQTDS